MDAMGRPSPTRLGCAAIQNADSIFGLTTARFLSAALSVSRRSRRSQLWQAFLPRDDSCPYSRAGSAG
jgi:hypothetical protein